MKKISILIFIFLMAVVTVVEAATDSENTNLQVTVSDTITIDCDGADGQDTVDLGTLTAGTPVTGSTSCVVTTNSDGGYVLEVEQDGVSGATTMDHQADATIDIIDKTSWDQTANTGDGNAVAYATTGLGFGVLSSTATKNTTWWGTGATCADAAQLYAGVPVNGASNNNIMEHANYSSTATTTNICYQLDVVATQQAGIYDGVITYTATTQ
ncbi:MAG: hypothetical protein KAT32_03250 [Candidatus Moranbacteria bacterium]|nr:hypothetical protein [Candidatus Moranbacteria bacterium]